MGNKSQSSNSEFLTGNLPLLKSDRVYNFFDNTCMDVAMAIATWCFMTGGTLALFVGVWDAIIATIAGNVVGVFLAVISSSISSAKYGIDHWTMGRSWLGNNGMKVILVIILLTQVGWAVTLSVMCGRSVENVIQATTGFVSKSGYLINVLGLIAAILAWLIAWKGPIVMRKMNAIVAPLMALVMVGMVVLISTAPGGWSAVFDCEPISPVPGGRMLNFMIAFEVNVGAGISWWASRGVMARLCKTTRAAYWPNMFGVCLAASIGTIIGVATSLAFNSIDPTEWMVPLGGLVLGLFSLVFIAFANLSSIPICAYDSCLGMRQYKIFENIGWGKLTFIFMVPTFLVMIFCPLFIYDHFYILMGIICVVYVPLVGIQMADYFFLRKQRINLASTYDKSASSRYRYWGGFNWVAVAVFIMSCIVYVLLFDPIMLAARPMFVYMSATGAALVFSVIAYTILGRIFLVNNKKGIGSYRDSDLTC